MTPIYLTPCPTIFFFLLDMLSHAVSFLHSTKPQFRTLPPPILTRISRIRHIPPFQMPLLNTPNNVHAQLPILLERILPMLRDRIPQRQIARNTANHHLAHGIILTGIRIHILHPPKSRIGLIIMKESPNRLHDILRKLDDLKLLAEEIEIEQWADVFFLLRVAQGFRVEPADEELEGEVVGVGEAVGFGAGGGVFFVVEAGAEEGGVVAEELFVEDPVGVFGADVDVDEGGGEESGAWDCQLRGLEAAGDRTR